MRGSGKRERTAGLLLAVALATTILAACAPGTGQASTPTPIVPTLGAPDETLAEAPTSALESPTPQASTPPDGQTSPSPTAVETPAATMAPPPTVTPLPTTAPPTSTPDATGTAAVSPTPFPTFTPPPPPPPIVGEHFIFDRPVPLDSAPWTDKSYPYAGTKGGTLEPHHGVEFPVGMGTPVLATAPGTVVVAGSDAAVAYGPQTDFYGNLVVVEHAPVGGKPVYTLYGHLSEVQVSEGQVVEAGTQLGLSGESGVAVGPHLHFEVRVGANDYTSTRNPLLWLRPFSEDGVVAAKVTGPAGGPAAEVPITLSRVDGPASFTSSTSYAIETVNGDDVIGENFAVDDVRAGYYEVIAGVGANRQTLDLWVYPGRLNWIEIVLK